jgi:GH35 family endo-1,4-beta-xylanase
MRIRLAWLLADNSLTFCCLKEGRVHVHNMLWHEYHYESVFRYIKKRKR